MNKSGKQVMRMTVFAASILEIGDPQIAGTQIAAIIRYLLNRIPDDKRGQAIANLRNKLWAMDAYEIASKKTPSTASIGQAITFVKTILFGSSPLYIRRVLEEIVRNL